MLFYFLDSPVTKKYRLKAQGRTAYMYFVLLLPEIWKVSLDATKLTLSFYYSKYLYMEGLYLCLTDGR